MDANEVAEALVEWAQAEIPELAAYDHEPDRKTQPLPDIAVSIGREEVAERDPTLGLEIANFGIEQARVMIRRASLLLMVDPSDPGKATDDLQGFVASLGAAITRDQTLGRRVPSASPLWSATYEPPFVEFDDGTRGRAATFSLVVVELI